MPGRKTNISFISSYVPRQCGVATFTRDLATSLAENVHGVSLADDHNVGIVALNDRDGEYQYGRQVHFEIRQHHRNDYRNAADFLNTNNTDVINLQHEYGLFGGPDGTYIIELLERLKKPVVTTLHTVLTGPSDSQRQVLARIAELSSAVVVLAERARSLLQEVYGIEADKIRLIHHGTPDVEFHDPNKFKERFMVKGRPVILTFGLLGPGKGIETMLDAIAMVVPKHPNVAYMILGATHPSVKRELGESYRLSLERRTVDLGIARNIFFHNHYVALPILVDFLKAADLYVTPYRSKEQIVSGTLAFAVACGKAVVSTPYWYAQEMLADGRGRLVDFDDPKGLARHINELLDDDALRLSIQKKAYQFGRQMIWPAVAKEYDKTYRQALKESARRALLTAAAEKPTLRLSLPELRLDHMYLLTDDTGILQHAIYATPDRNHGYCTDDNARALLAAAMSYRLLNDSSVLPFLERYLSFLVHAWNGELKRFRNFMSYDRRWLDQEGTEDCLARAIWALGYLTTHPPAEQDLSLAGELFHKAVDSTGDIRHPRAQALCIIGFCHYLRHDEGGSVPRRGGLLSSATSKGPRRALLESSGPRSGTQPAAPAPVAPCRDRLQALARSLLDRYKQYRSDGWEWCDEQLTYNSARVPQALILAGAALDDTCFVECGITSLRWLLQTHTTADGKISLVGNKGWWPKGGEKADFDQQPIDAAALVGACNSAFKVTGEPEWLTHMRRCFEWFLGRNVLETPLVDFKTTGCCDGLQSDGLNRNQGAESTLSWLLSLLIMYETHPGQPHADE